MKDKKVLGIFLLRVALGAVFVAHGWSKIEHMPGIIGFFGSIGLAPFFAYLVAYVELIGGFAVLIGLYSRVAAYLLAIIMVFAIFLARFKVGFVGGYELETMLFFSSLVVAWSGSGPYSISGKMCGCGACGKCGMKLI